jgi:putative chitinase
MKVTAAILKLIAPTAKATILNDLEVYLTDALVKYGIDTERRIVHFLAQAAHESAGFRTLQEYASGAEYQGRHDLGNTHPGDGIRFKGRGIFQLTGRANYAEMSKKLGVDLIAHPELAASGKISVLTACEYWNSRKISHLADVDSVREVTRKINGGLNGLAQREAYLTKTKRYINEIMRATSEPHVMYHKGDAGDGVRIVQVALNNHGAKLTVDGAFGPATEKAVIKYAADNNLTPLTGEVTDTIYNSLTKV